MKYCDSEYNLLNNLRINCSQQYKCITQTALLDVFLYFTFRNSCSMITEMYISIRGCHTSYIDNQLVFSAVITACKATEAPLDTFWIRWEICYYVSINTVFLRAFLIFKITDLYSNFMTSPMMTRCSLMHKVIAPMETSFLWRWLPVLGKYIR